MTAYELAHLRARRIAGSLVGERPAGALLRRVGRWTMIAAIWTAIGVALGLFLAVSLPYLFGYRTLVVLSGSMEPTLQVGDVVVVDQISPLDAKVGDIASFRDPNGGGRLITHRVRSIERQGRYVYFVTKGDANTSVEHWKITIDGKIGKVSYDVPRIGYALYWIRGRFGRMILVVIPALSLGAFELFRIWRPRPEEEGSDEGSS